MPVLLLTKAPMPWTEATPTETTETPMISGALAPAITLVLPTTTEVRAAASLPDLLTTEDPLAIAARLTVLVPALHTDSLPEETMAQT